MVLLSNTTFHNTDEAYEGYNRFYYILLSTAINSWEL